MDVDRPSWGGGSTLVKNFDENKTYILVKLSESFANAIQEYSSASHHNSHTNNHYQSNHNNHSNIQNGSARKTHPSTTIAAAATNSHKRPKLNHNIKSDHHHHHATTTKRASNSSTTTTDSATSNQQIQAPTIKFVGSRGAIKFPNGKIYDFSLEQSDNPVECIKQVKNRWESVGKMSCCLHVKGKDDVYQRTRTKMEAAEQEKRKYCTKLLGDYVVKTDTKSNSFTNINTNGNINNSNSGNNHNHHHVSHNNHSHSHNHTGSNNNNNSTNVFNNNSSSNNSNSNGSGNHNNNSSSSNNNNNNSSDNHCSNSNNINTNNVRVNETTNGTNHVNLSKYPDIKDMKQFEKYKTEFDKDWHEYRNLHSYLTEIETKFRKLDESLKQSIEGSPEWESKRELIFSEYERFKSDSNFHKARTKYKVLVNKLLNIKEKIIKFRKQTRGVKSKGKTSNKRK